jgi:electron transfer flavoprotein beta subunit
MKIIVCVSLVPDSTTKVKISPDGKSIDSTGVSYIINPYDEFAVEEGVRMKEKNAGSEVIAVSFGTDKSKEAIKKAFQMGADKGVLIKAGSDDFDSVTAAKNLAEYIKTQNPDIVFFGKQSIDFDGLLLPNMVAEILNLPSINVVVKLDINGSSVTAEREIEGGKETVEAQMPIIIGTQKGINDPRYPNLKAIMAAKSKPIEEIPAYDNTRDTEVLDMTLPPAKGQGKIVNDVHELVKLLREEAKVI